MTRRTLWASCLSAVAALATWALISRDAGPPHAAGAHQPFMVSTFEGASPTTGAASPGAVVEPGSDEDAHPGSSAFTRRSAVYAQAAHADEAQLGDLIERARSIADASERVGVLEILLLKLAEHDRAAAVRQAALSERSDALHLIGALAGGAPDAVWSALDQLSDPLARMQLQAAVIDAWTLRDAERAFRSVAAMAPDWTREQLLRQAAAGVARNDPQAAVALVDAAAPSDREALFMAIADQWARNDPGGAAQWIEGLPLRMQGQLAYRIAGPFVTQQPEEALAWALRISRSPGRNLWSHMIGLMALRNPEEALRRAQAAENPAQRAQATGRAVAAVAARDPALATAYLHKLPFGEVRSQALAEVAMQIARTTPESAIDWLRELDERDMRETAASAMAGELAAADPDGAARLIDRVPKGARSHWIQEVAQAYAQSNPERGLEWVNRWREEAPQAAANFMQQVAMRSPDEALALVDRIEEPSERDDALYRIVGMLAMQSPQAAARQIGRIDGESSRTRAAGALAGVWARHDSAAATKWARSLESGRMRDIALGSVASQVEELDDILEVIGEIHSPEQQMHAVFNAAARRAHTDPETVRALVRRYPLDPGRQQQLDAMLQEQRR